MLKYNKDLSIDHLPLDVYEDMVSMLNDDDSWKTLAQYVTEKFDFSSLWMRNLKNRGTSDDSPAKKLLVELNIRLCMVNVLSNLLRKCNLNKALAILHTTEPLEIIIHPDDDIDPSDNLTVTLGHKLHLVCKARGLPPPDYQWYYDNTLLESETSDELNITINSINQRGLYKCKIRQVDHREELLDEKFSKPVFVDVGPTPVKIEKEPLAYKEVKEADCLVLDCEADCHPSPRYQWYRDNNRLDDQISNVLRIEKFTSKDEGKYYCHIANTISEKYTQQCTVLTELPKQKAVAKVALLVANENYENQEILRTPRNDVAKVAKILNDLGFYIICLADLTLAQMKNAIKIFCNSLVEGTYGLFYFAGHGFKMQENYMLPIDAPANYLRNDAICKSQLLSMGLKNDPSLFVVILDMCQTIPPKECNPKIYEEVPPIHEYKGRKNLRNLLQAYSTSSYRPCYERMGKNYGFYATHLCKYLEDNIPVIKVFEQVGKSIDTWLKGAERKQIPMFATTITKPYRLTDGISQGRIPGKIKYLEELICFPMNTVDINFQQTGVKCKAIISQYQKPYLNLVQVSLIELDEKWEINFYNSAHTKRNNLFQCSAKNKCWLLNSQNNKGPMVISLLENNVHVGATLLEINDFVPYLLKKLNE